MPQRKNPRRKSTSRKREAPERTVDTNVLTNGAVLKCWDLCNRSRLALRGVVLEFPRTTLSSELCPDRRGVRLTCELIPAPQDPSVSVATILNSVNDSGFNWETSNRSRREMIRKKLQRKLRRKPQKVFA